MTKAASSTAPRFDLSPEMVEATAAEDGWKAIEMFRDVKSMWS
jgi:hypothetical protein